MPPADAMNGVPTVDTRPGRCFETASLFISDRSEVVRLAHRRVGGGGLLVEPDEVVARLLIEQLDQAGLGGEVDGILAIQSKLLTLNSQL